MFPLWSTLLGGSFVFLDVCPSILFLVFPFFECFGFSIIGRVSSSSSYVPLKLQVQALVTMIMSKTW